MFSYTIVTSRPADPNSPPLDLPSLAALQVSFSLILIGRGSLIWRWRYKVRLGFDSRVTVGSISRDFGSFELRWLTMMLFISGRSKAEAGPSHQDKEIFLRLKWARK